MRKELKLTLILLSFTFLFILCVLFVELVQSSFAINRLESISEKTETQQFTQPLSQNTRYLEAFLRHKVTNKEISSDELEQIKEVYYEALQKKPSWPYFHSGVMQISSRLNSVQLESVKNTVRWGRHELKLVKSVSEVLFYNWRVLSSEQRVFLLDYLSGLSESNQVHAINSASRFGRLFEVCDYIYEAQSLSHPTCLANFWKPLLKN